MQRRGHPLRERHEKVAPEPVIGKAQRQHMDIGTGDGFQQRVPHIERIRDPVQLNHHAMRSVAKPHESDQAPALPLVFFNEGGADGGQASMKALDDPVAFTVVGLLELTAQFLDHGRRRTRQGPGAQRVRGNTTQTSHCGSS